MKLAFLNATANRVVTERTTVPRAGSAKAGRVQVSGLDSSLWLAAVFRSGGGKNRAAASDRQ